MDETAEREDDRRFPNLGGAVAGGVVAAIAGAIGIGAVGAVSGAEARTLVEGVLPSIRFLASSVMAASATILALMMTLLGLSHSSEQPLQRVHYRRIQLVARLASVAIVGATVLLLLLAVPLGESEIIERFYSWVYYILVGAASGLGGLQTAVVIVLYRAISGLITVVIHGEESPLVAQGGGAGPSARGPSE